jgi:hypothetical protein
LLLVHFLQDVVLQQWQFNQMQTNFHMDEKQQLQHFLAYIH